MDLESELFSSLLLYVDGLYVIDKEYVNLTPNVTGV